MCYILFIHQLVDEDVGCLHFLATVDNATVNISIKIFE